MTNLPRIAIDAARVEKMILTMAEIGAHSGTGVWRTTYSPEWGAANALFSEWATQAGLTPRQDAVGNIWARLEGSEGGKAVVSGSHIDTQCPGGRYDGTLGILAALIAVETLHKRFGPPKRPVEVLSLCEEEGSRFPSAQFWGSRGIVGAIMPEDPEQVMGKDGVSIAEAMRAVGLDPARAHEAKREDIAAFLELHIEQGPILEAAGLSVAVVDAITGIRHTEVVLEGEANHAGAFPMDLRQDPMMGCAEVITGVVGHAEALGRPAVTTVGRLAVDPNGAAIVPQTVTFTIDARHPNPVEGAKLHAHHDAVLREVAERRQLKLSQQIVLDHPACPSDPALVDLLHRSARAQGVGVMQMASGAGHDSQQMAKICPVAMIFVRSAGGRSHTPEEFSTIEDICEGIAVLAGALYEAAWV